MRNTFYTLGLLALYVVLAVLFPEYISRALFMIPIVITIVMGYVGGWKQGVFAAGFGLTAAMLLLGTEVVPANDFAFRIMSFLIITAGVNYTQYLRDQYEVASSTMEAQDKRLSIISNSLSDVLITIDDKSIITLVNPAVENTFGWTAEELIGKPLTMLMPEDLREQHLKGFNRYVASGKKTIDWKGIEVIGLKKDGTKFPIEISFGEFNDGQSRHFSAVLRDISIRKEYDKKMQQLAAIVESTEDAIIGKDTEGFITSWNKGAEQLYQYKESEVIGKHVTVLFPEDKIPEEARILKKILAGERISNYESIRKKKDGTLFPVSITISPIKNSEGQVIGASKIARDISQRKAQELELERSRERYKTFIDNSEEAIWMIEYRPPVDLTAPTEKQINDMYAHGYITEANATMTELYKLGSREDVLGKPVAVVSPRTKQGDAFLKEFINNGYTMFGYESVSVDQDGNTRYGSTSFKGIVYNDKLVRAWVVQRETTNQKLQEQEIKKSEERYKAFIENSDEGIARIEFRTPIDTSLPVHVQVEKFFGDGYIAETNDATAKIMGMESADRILHRPINEIEVRSEGDSRFLKLFIENHYSMKDFESSEQLQDKVKYHSTSMKGIIEDGKWVRAWMVRRDITRQKEGQVERERLLKQAEEAKRSLEIASAEKDRFLANLSHELRTPLVSILGYSAMLLDTPPESDAARKMIETINKNAKLQVQLIEDLLDLSRIISGKIELKKANFPIGTWVTDGIDTFRKQATDKGLTIIEKVEDCSFYGDRKRLSQVILNLLSNAVKFTEKGTITVCARCSPEFLTLRIVDTGIGIDPKNFGMLFQPFKQIDSSSTRAKQGLGLGLSIVKNIVELHKGKVTVESKLGEGSEFTVYLPAMTGKDVVEHQEQVQVSPNVTFKGITMLLVEDDPDSAGFIKYLYEQKGATVDWVDSAKKAREKLVQNKYNLYIFDLSMPEEDGISLIKSLRDGGDKTKAVALTAFADVYYEKKAIESGFDMFLKKPSSLSALLSVINLIR
jgi:PAS domain S-box-containing protein